jgi:hypothetical protein
MALRLADEHFEETKISPVSLTFPHGTRVRSNVDDEGQGRVVMVVSSRLEAYVPLKRE